MAKTIPQLTDAATVNAADELIIQQSGITKRATASELFASTPFKESAAMSINSGGISLYVQQTDASTRKLLRANPVDGGRLVINGVTRQFGGALSMDTTPYSADTLYYVYAYWTGSAIALELSTTAYAFDYADENAVPRPHAGIAIKTGDATRTLVGLTYLDASKEIVNNVQTNSLLNWYNPTLNFLAGQLAAADTPPTSWSVYEAEVTSRYNSADPFNAANFQEIGTASDNKIQLLHWGGALGRFPAIVFGISGSAMIQGASTRLRLRFGTTSRGPMQPVSSDMSMSAPARNFFHNVSGTTTFSFGGFGRHEINLWGQIVGSDLAATGVASTDIITCTGNEFANNLPVRFTALTGGAGLSVNTRYFVRGLSTATFQLSTTPLYSGVTGVASTDVITAAGHTFTNNQLVQFTALTGGSGLTTSTDYYVRDIVSNTFKLAASSGGAAINFTTDITAGSIGAPIINFTTDISAANIGANGATVYVNTFASYYG
jgi:hypothetical protein